MIRRKEGKRWEGKGGEGKGGEGKGRERKGREGKCLLDWVGGRGRWSGSGGQCGREVEEGGEVEGK